MTALSLRVTVCKSCRTAVVHGPVTVDVGCQTVRCGDAVEHVRPQDAIILRHLMLSGDVYVSEKELSHLLYGGYAHGGALTANKVVAVKMHAIRRVLDRLSAPITIEAAWGRGYSIRHSPPVAEPLSLMEMGGGKVKETVG